MTLGITTLSIITLGTISLGIMTFSLCGLNTTLDMMTLGKTPPAYRTQL